MEKAVFFPLQVKILKGKSERLSRHINFKANLTLEWRGIFHIFKSPTDWSPNNDNIRQKSSGKKRQSLLGLTKHSLT